MHFFCIYCARFDKMSEFCKDIVAFKFKFNISKIMCLRERRCKDTMKILFFPNFFAKKFKKNAFFLF